MALAVQWRNLGCTTQCWNLNCPNSYARDLQLNDCAVDPTLNWKFHRKEAFWFTEILKMSNKTSNTAHHVKSTDKFDQLKNDSAKCRIQLMTKKELIKGEVTRLKSMNTQNHATMKSMGLRFERKLLFWMRNWKDELWMCSPFLASWLCFHFSQSRLKTGLISRDWLISCIYIYQIWVKHQIVTNYILQSVLIDFLLYCPKKWSQTLILKTNKSLNLNYRFDNRVELTI